MKRAGFTLIELLVAIAFMSLGLLSFLWLNSFSQKESMDAYYETLGLALAKEPIEVFRAFGYKWLKKVKESEIPPLPNYPIGEDKQVETTGVTDPYPIEARFFKRKISIFPYGDRNTPSQALEVVVEVSPIENTPVFSWLNKGRIVRMDALIVEEPE